MSLQKPHSLDMIEHPVRKLHHSTYRSCQNKLICTLTNPDPRRGVKMVEGGGKTFSTKYANEANLRSNKSRHISA